MDQVGIELLYDTNKAESNNKNLTNSFTNLDKKNKDSSKSGTMAMAMAVAVGNVMASGFNKLSSKMMGSIPMLGETLSQAGSVIFNNLFKPLADVLMPMLRSLMGWIQQNRAGFVQLGSVISGMFMAVVSIVKSVFSVIGNILSKVFSAVTGGAKATFKNVADFMNLVLLKIVFIAQFILILLGPVFELIGDAIVFIISKFKEMFDFIVAFIKDPMKALNDFSALTAGLVAGAIVAVGVALLGTLIPAIISAVSATWAFTAALLANPIVLIVMAIIALVTGIVWMIKNFDKVKQAMHDAFDWVVAKVMGIWAAIKDAFGKAWDYVKDVGTKIKDFFGGIGSWITDKFNAVIDWFKSLPEKIGKFFSDAWAKVKAAGGAILDFFTGGSDTKTIEIKGDALAKAKGGGGTVGGSSNSQNNPVNITVNGAENPDEAAKKLLETAQKNNSIQNQEMAQGTR